MAVRYNEEFKIVMGDCQMIYFGLRLVGVDEGTIV